MDPDFFPILNPGSMGQKSTGSRIRNTGFGHSYHAQLFATFSEQFEALFLLP
jgi:hypothetical protein